MEGRVKEKIGKDQTRTVKDATPGICLHARPRVHARSTSRRAPIIRGGGACLHPNSARGGQRANWTFLSWEKADISKLAFQYFSPLLHAPGTSCTLCPHAD